jgi:hypothetical protein
VHEIGRRVEIAQEAQPREDAGEGVRLRQDVDELDLEQIARPGALDQHRSRDRMDGAAVHRGHGLRGHAGPELPVAAVACLEQHLLAFALLEDGRDVRVPPVVPGPGLVAQPPAPVDLDALQARGSPLTR